MHCIYFYTTWNSLFRGHKFRVVQFHRYCSFFCLFKDFFLNPDKFRAVEI